MKVALISDFRDSYDHWFDREGASWSRESRTNRTRAEDLQLLRESGFSTPCGGVLGSGWSVLPSDEYVVVYYDERAHRGEGKCLVPLRRALLDYLGHFATKHCGSVEPPSYSYRCLLVGGLPPCWFMYSSMSDWRSNVGDVSVERLTRHDQELGAFEEAARIAQGSVRSPLVAVDLIRGDSRELLAVDFNTAPGVHGLVSGLWSPREVAEAIKRKFVQLQE